MRSRAQVRKPRWYVIPARALFVTFLLTLLSFAVTLLLSILGMLIIAQLHHGSPDLRFAYRGIALPAAGVTGSMVLIFSLALEIRHYRQSKTLAGIVRASR